MKAEVKTRQALLRERRDAGEPAYEPEFVVADYADEQPDLRTMIAQTLGAMIHHAMPDDEGDDDQEGELPPWGDEEFGPGHEFHVEHQNVETQEVKDVDNQEVVDHNKNVEGKPEPEDVPATGE